MLDSRIKRYVYLFDFLWIIVECPAESFLPIQIPSALYGSAYFPKILPTHWLFNLNLHFLGYFVMSTIFLMLISYLYSFLINFVYMFFTHFLEVNTYFENTYSYVRLLWQAFPAFEVLICIKFLTVI